MNLSKTTAAPIKLLGSATTTTKKPLQKSANSLTSSLSKLLGLTPTKPKENDGNENVIKNSDQSSSAKIETEAENITTIISDLRAIQDKLNVKLPTESETVKEDVQEYKVQNEEDENEQELHETIPDIKQEALLTVSIVSDLDIKILNPSTIDIDRTSSSVSDTESKQPVAESPLPSIQDDIGSLNESVSEELSIVDDSAKIVQSESILESTEPTVLENLPNVDKSDPVVANTIKPVTDAESLEELLEIPPLSQQEIQIVDVSPVLDGETTESSLSQLPLTSLESEALQSNGPKRPTEEAVTLTNVDPAVNIQPEVPTDVPLGIPSGTFEIELN